MADYFRAIAAGQAPRVCELSTVPAIAAQFQRHDATEAICVQALTRVLTSATALRNSARATAVGPAVLTSGYGYVEIAMPPKRQGQYVPVRLVRGRWRVDGIPVPSRDGG